MFRTPHLASMKTEEKFMFLIYELFLGLSRGEETFDFGKSYGFTHDYPLIELPRRTFFPLSFSTIALLPLEPGDRKGTPWESFTDPALSEPFLPENGVQILISPLSLKPHVLEKMTLAPHSKTFK